MTRENTSKGTNPITIGVITAATDITTTPQSYFSRNIGNTTFIVSVVFNKTAAESIDDKILRLVASDFQNGEVQQCG